MNTENEQAGTAKTFAAISRRIVKYAGDSYLPDELSLFDEPGEGEADGNTDGPAGDGSVSAVPRPVEEKAPARTKKSLPATKHPWGPEVQPLSLPANLESNLRLLLEREAELARALRKGGAAQKSISHLDRWFNDHLSAEGFWSDDPWQSIRLLPSLHRLTLALPDQDQWRDHLRSVLKAVCQTLCPKGWLDPGRGGFTAASRSFAKLWEQIAKDAGLGKLGKLAPDLWSSRRTAATSRSSFGFQSDEAQIAVLRQHWARRGFLLGIDHCETDCKATLEILGTQVFNGNIRSTVTLDGTTHSVGGDWEAVCWFSDSEAEYLELQTTTDEGWQLNRQFFLARSAELFLVADTLLLPEKRDVRLGMDWSAVAGSGLKGILPTRAQQVQGLDFALRVLPVGLPSNPMEGSTGKLSWNEGLRVEIAGETDCLFLPVALTWAKKELPPQDFWRSLSITNDRRPVGGEEAAAYRIPHANRQIIFFRSHRGVHRYAFVGVQTFAECLIGTLGSDGELTEWVTIEPDSE